MSTLSAKGTAEAAALTATSSVAYDPATILEITNQTQTLESIYIYGLSASDWIRIISATALIIYIASKIIGALASASKVAGKFLSLFKK